MGKPDPLVFPGTHFFGNWIAMLALASIGAWFVLSPPKRNGFAGVRVPWTYADEEIWDASQRLCGWMTLAAMAGFALWFPVGMALILAMAAATILYARGQYLRKYGTTRTWKGDEGLIDYRPVVKCENCGHLNRVDRGADLASLRCEECRHSLGRD